jgi:hypothetical protein
MPRKGPNAGHPHYHEDLPFGYESREDPFFLQNRQCLSAVNLNPIDFPIQPMPSPPEFEGVKHAGFPYNPRSPSLSYRYF